MLSSQNSGKYGDMIDMSGQSPDEENKTMLDGT